jgi:hypothetical protein
MTLGRTSAGRAGSDATAEQNVRAIFDSETKRICGSALGPRLDAGRPNAASFARVVDRIERATLAAHADTRRRAWLPLQSAAPLDRAARGREQILGIKAASQERTPR